MSENIPYLDTERVPWLMYRYVSRYVSIIIVNLYTIGNIIDLIYRPMEDQMLLATNCEKYLLRR